MSIHVHFCTSIHVLCACAHMYTCDRPEEKFGAMIWAPSNFCQRQYLTGLPCAR